MAGMQRFVTYLYSYKENEKLHNTGFAKIEIRGGATRLEIHLKGAVANDIPPSVYLFTRENDRIWAVEIGKLQMGIGGADYRATLPSGNIGASPYMISDMKGIWIPVNETYMFASQWDDGAFGREQIKIFSAGEENESSRPVQEAEMTQPEEPVQHVQNGTENTPHDTASQENEPQDTPPEDALENEPVVQATEIPAEGQIPLENTLLESFLKLQKRSRSIELFETGERQVCGIRIELRDLRELPRKYWALGNNSFLLHGFFSYQYLLLGKRTEEGKEEIFIGVPGRFHNQERIMASLFGFTEFLPDTTEQKKGGLQEIDTSENLYKTLRAAEMPKVAQMPAGYWCHFMME